MKRQNFFQRLISRFRFNEINSAQQEQVKYIHLDPIGSSGVENYSGYFSEEYLKELRGTRAADLYDKMRRGDSQIKMVLSAVKNPIKSATWTIEPADESEEQKRMAALASHIIFKDTDKTWQRLLHEILSEIDFGHSVFEIVDKVVVNDPTFGSYNGIKSFGFRSQKTLERWNMDQNGKLLSVTQYAYGELQKLVDIQADFLLIFTMDKEGDNYEGISALRPVYGAWLRKQTYQKLMAIGVEKYAVPTPIGRVPENKENSEQYQNFKAALEIYTSHQSNYITLPAGWEVELKSTDFDASKVQAAIDAEDKAIVKAFLANFLELGMSGTGSFALSFDLSDFFLGGLEHVAKNICEEMDKIIKRSIDMNFGPQLKYPTMKCSGISDRAGKELAEILKILSEAKVIIPDDPMEDNIRKRYGLTPPSKDGQRSMTPSPAPYPTQFTEKKKDQRILLAESNAKAIIKAAGDELKVIMQEQLADIGNDLVDQIIGKLKNATESQRINVLKDVDTRGKNAYRDLLLQALTNATANGINSARKEVPKASKTKLSEDDNSIRLGPYKELPVSLEDLPPNLRKRVALQADLLTESQMADLKKSVYFQFGSSVDSTDSDAQIQMDLFETVSDYTESASVIAAAGNAAAKMVNEGRNAFFFEPSVLNEIASFTFMNADPVSPICQDLNGTTFAADDTTANRYFPPLHHNCKSYIIPNLKGGSRADKEIETLSPSEKSLDKYITLSEQERCCPHD